MTPFNRVAAAASRGSIHPSHRHEGTAPLSSRTTPRMNTRASRAWGGVVRAGPERETAASPSQVTLACSVTGRRVGPEAAARPKSVTSWCGTQLDGGGFQGRKKNGKEKGEERQSDVNVIRTKKIQPSSRIPIKEEVRDPPME